VRRTFWPSHLLLSDVAYVPVASCRYCSYRVLADKVSGNPTGNPKVSAADLLGRLDLLALPLFHHHSGSALSLVSPISSTPFRCTDDSVDCFWCLAPFEFVHQTIICSVCARSCNAGTLCRPSTSFLYLFYPSPSPPWYSLDLICSCIFILLGSVRLRTSVLLLWRSPGGSEFAPSLFATA